ncbi:hypothetical protein RN001_006070 [Aquatica leii]|uniref:Phosphatidic acid phosphatase type 2/haloperoxidase domain-containing protein n=1 Tax=Aquatica leii TaxID=1421715 RepID=A0AAN7SB12_9COLE|nr:hypothetical protein RN001_006070 [Aquatica leii]
MSVIANKEVIYEISIRIILWLLFILIDQIEPFKRTILPEEVWLYKYPVKPSYVPSSTLWIIVFIVPTAILLRDYIRYKNKVELYNSLLGLTLTYGLVGFFTQFLKVIVGRPRPNFFYKCFPDGESSDFINCKNYSWVAKDVRRSFPSGHSSFAFGSMFFISLYLAGKLKVFVDGGKGNAWRLCFCICPVVLALSIAVSRTCDYHHHYEDVIAGSLIGVTFAYISYRLYFPSVYSMDCNFSYASQSTGVNV